MKSSTIVKANRLRNLILIALTVLSTASVVYAQAPPWKTYTYPLDGFSAAFPSEPKQDKQDVPTEAGSFELRMYTADDAHGEVMVGVFKLGAVADGKDPDALLQGGKDGALQNSNSHLLRERKIVLGVNHGLEFESENDSMHATARIYMVGTTMYEVMVAYPIAQPYGHVEEFLNAFKLIDPPSK